MKVPVHVIKYSRCESARAWKSQKRKQARAARKAIDELRAGCAYFPNDGKDVDIAAQAIDRIIKDISVKNFGR